MGEHREDGLRLTPLDIQSYRFARSLRGCDPKEVESFLRLVGEHFERVVRLNAEREERVAHCEEQLVGMYAREEILRRTLTTAREVSEGLRQRAVREAEAMIAEAQVKAKKILDTAHCRVATLSEDIRRMKGVRTQLSTAVRNTIETHLSVLESTSPRPRAGSEPRSQRIPQARRSGASRSGRLIETALIPPSPRAPAGLRNAKSAPGTSTRRQIPNGTEIE